LGLSVLAAGCRDSAPDDLIVEERTTDALVFVKSTAEETLNRSWAESNLFILSPISPDGKVAPLTDFRGASVSDPCVSFDGERVLFSMRPPGEDDRNLYEIRADGTGLRQVTRGGGHDFDPLYLPGGGIMFTSSRDGEMDEYNHSPAEHLYTCDADGGDLRRVSFNQSDDFDPALLPNGQVIYTRWEHFGTMNRFPLFFTNPDGTGTFHKFGPHDRNFFHPQPTPDGRIIAVESTSVEEDAGPLAVLKPEEGPADPVLGPKDLHWDVVTVDVNTGGAPWPHGAFKYPFPIGDNRFVASYTLPAAEDDQVDYALYTFTLSRTGDGGSGDPASYEIRDLSFLYNDPAANEYDAQLLAPREKPPAIPSTVDESLDYGVFLAQDVFNRGSNDGQEVPRKSLDPIGRIAVLAARPTMRGESSSFSANEFEKRALIGFAPVEPDGSFRIKVPARTPISFATLDEHDRGFVVKRTWLYVQPGEEFDQCTGCHEDRLAGGPSPTNPAPAAASRPPTDLNIPRDEFIVINYETDIGPIVEAKCAGCHTPTFVERDSLALPDSLVVAVIDTIPPPGDLDLRSVPDTTEMGGGIFPLAYVNLSGESETMESQVVEPAFPRRSKLIDYMLGLGSRAGSGFHPEAEAALTADERRLFNLWVLLGAQYK
jgi:hypothetical protein